MTRGGAGGGRERRSKCASAGARARTAKQANGPVKADALLQHEMEGVKGREVTRMVVTRGEGQTPSAGAHSLEK